MKARVLSPLTVALLFASAGWAQVPLASQSATPSSIDLDQGADIGTHTLTGSVTDSSGHPLNGAQITVRDPGTGQLMGSAVTLPDGSFEIANLPRGRYLITALSGIYQAQEQISLLSSYGEVVLRIPIQYDSGGVQGGNTVSVRQFQVPEKARKLLDRARKAYKEQKQEEAVRRTEEALREDPDFSEALTFRAILYLAGNQGEEARKLTEKAVREDPNYGLGYIVLGAAYNMLTRFDDALRVLGRAFSFTPQSWQGYYEAARAHLGKNEFRQALEQVNKAAQYAPKNFTAIHLLRAQACLGLNDYPQAAAALETYLKADPNGSGAAEAREVLNRMRADGTIASE
jgi:tetratricopeptide (TPR) repeat protein